MYGTLRACFFFLSYIDESQGVTEDSECSMVSTNSTSYYAGCWDSGTAVGCQFQYFCQFRTVFVEFTAAWI